MLQLEEFTAETKMLTEDEKLCLKQQNTRLVPDHKALMLEKDAQKYWDLFYKRNDTRFFKDRHWATREFTELVTESTTKRTLLEIGCGVGNLIFPLIEEKLNFRFVGCDLSPRAVEIIKRHPLYNADTMNIFQTDITTSDILAKVEHNTVDIATLIFVLSAIHPDKFLNALRTIYRLLKSGGLLLFRDYGLHDMAQLRFKAGHKIAENFYMRQDGTRSYYFSTEYVAKLFTDVGFEVVENSYIHRRTVNKKEKIDVPRIFVQAKLVKPK